MSANARLKVSRDKKKLYLIALTNLFGLSDDLLEIFWINILENFKEEIVESERGSPVLIPGQVHNTYSIIHKATGRHTGNDANGPIYGELTQGSMQKIFNVIETEFSISGRQLRFLDIGSGLGKPNYHANALDAELSWGVEMILGRYNLCMHNGNALQKAELLNTGINFLYANACDAETTDPANVVYMFDLGNRLEERRAIAKQINNSRYCVVVVSFHDKATMDEAGLLGEVIHKSIVTMSGSAESHTVYFYKVNLKPATVYGSGRESSKILVNGRELYCSNFYKKTILDSLDRERMKEVIKASEEAFLFSGRPKRTRGEI